MKTWLRYPLLLAASIIAGHWIGSKQAIDKNKISVPDTKEKDTTSAPLVSKKWQRNDFIYCIENKKSTLESIEDNPTKDWTIEEIKAAMNECIKHPEYYQLWGGGSGSSASNALIMCWMNRDINSFTEWYLSQSPETKGRLAFSVSMHWPMSLADEGIEFYLANKDSVKGLQEQIFKRKSIMKNAALGVANLDRHLNYLQDHGIFLSNGTMIDLPKNFDFVALSKTPSFQRMISLSAGESMQFFPLLQSWSVQNRAQYFDWVLSTNNDNLLKSALWHIFSNRDNEKSPAKWIGEKYDSCNEEQQKLISETILNQTTLRNNQALVEFIHTIKSPQAKENMIASGINRIVEGDAANLLPILSDLTNEKKIELLKNVKNEKSQKQRMTTPKWKSDDEKLLREKLREWNASETQANEIIDHINQENANVVTP